MSTIHVPTDLLPLLRRQIAREMGAAGEQLDATPGYSESFALAVQRLEALIPAWRSLEADSVTYPVCDVDTAAEYLIHELESIIKDDHKSVAEVRELLEQIDRLEALREMLAAGVTA